MIAASPSTSQVTEILQHLEAVEQGAYEHQVDAHLAEGLQQARNQQVKKFGIRDVEASTAEIIDRHRVAPTSNPSIRA